MPLFPRLFVRCIVVVMAGALLASQSGYVSADSANEMAGNAPKLTPCRIEGFGGFIRTKAECGTFSVPLDYDQAAGAHIDLAIARVPGLTRQRAASALVFIAGGPGQASIESFVSWRHAFGLIRRNQDILLIDQRGTGQSSKQQCDMPIESEQMDDIDLGLEETRKYTRKCIEKLGDDVRFYTTSNAVRDIEAVRAALGYEQLDVYGISYGTRVAQHYLRRYPEHTRTVIIDGVAPVDLPLGPTLALDAQATLDSILDRCDTNTQCIEAFGNVREKLQALRQTVKEAPQTITYADPITGKIDSLEFSEGHLMMALRLMSYSPDTAALLPLMIDSASKGNYQPFAAQAMMNMENLGQMLSYGMHNTVVCTEDVPFFDQVTVSEQELEESYLGTLMLQSLKATCELWPTGPIDEDFKKPFSSDVPVLVLSGEYDPVTPPVNGERAKNYLGNALHIVVSGQGHGIAPVGCMPHLMSQFVEQRSFEELDISCMERQQAAPFFTSFSGPEP